MQQPMSTVLSLPADVEDGQSAPVSESGEDAAGRGNNVKPQVSLSILLCATTRLTADAKRHGNTMQRPGCAAQAVGLNFL